MKFFTLLLAATIGLVAAQDLEGQPECAKACIVSAIAAVGCKPEDTGCLCNSEKQAALTKEATPCMIKACTNPADLIKAKNAGEAQCSRYSATATASPTGSVDNASITTGSSTGSAGAASTTSSSRAGAAAAMATPAAFVMGVIGAMAM